MSWTQFRTRGIFLYLHYFCPAYGSVIVIDRLQYSNGGIQFTTNELLHNYYTFASYQTFSFIISMYLNLKVSNLQTLTFLSIFCYICYHWRQVAWNIFLVYLRKTCTRLTKESKRPCSATAGDLWGMLLGRLLVGTGMGIGPPVAALYVAEV